MNKFRCKDLPKASNAQAVLLGTDPWHSLQRYLRSRGNNFQSFSYPQSPDRHSNSQCYGIRLYMRKMQFISEHMVHERSLWVYSMNMKVRRLRRRTRKCFLSYLCLYIFTYGFKLRCEWPLVCMYWIHKRMHVLCTKYECLASIRTHIIVLTSA